VVSRFTLLNLELAITQARRAASDRSLQKNLRAIAFVKQEVLSRHSNKLTLRTEQPGSQQCHEQLTQQKSVTTLVN
jgi:hypothetical protein